MAILEFEFKGIDQNFRSSAANVLKDIDKIKSAFSGIGVGIGVDLKTALDGQKVALNDTKIQTQELVKAGKELDNQNKQTRNSIAELTLEQKKLTSEQRASRANLQDSPYSKLSRELNEMRNEAKNLGAQMILLDSAGMKTSSTYNTLENRFKQVQKETLSLDNSIKKLDSDLGQNNRRVGAYGNALGGLQQKQSGANGVTLEFNRIIQDLPFGMMGIGNNLQQLSENWKTYTAQAKASAQANGTNISSMGLLRGALAGIFSPLNLLSLGISVATSGWVIYEKWQQKANKATKEAKDEMDKLRDSLSKYNQAMAEGEAKGKIEEARLNRLMSIYKDLGQSQKTRKNAYQEIMSMYESYFGKLSDEEKKTFNLTKAYDRLSVSILKTAKARAFQDIIEQNIKDIEVLNKSIEKSGSLIPNALKEVEKYNKALSEDNQIDVSGRTRAMYKATSDASESNLNNILIENNKLVKKRNALTYENWNYEQKILDLSQQGAKVAETYNESTKNTTQSVKDQRDYLLEIQQILQNSQTRVDTSGEILNWDKELIKVHDYYDKQEIALQKMLVSSQNAYKKDSSKRQQIEQAINSTRITLHNNMINELSKIDDKYFSEGMAKVAELNAKYSDSMDLDTRSNALKKVRDEFAKLREEFKNDPIISQEMLDKWQQNQTLKVNWEFDNKDLEEWGKLNDKIQETIDKPFSGKNTRSIQAELEKRIDIIKRLLEQLSRATGQPFDQAEFDRLSTELKNKSTEKYNTEQAKKDIQDYVTIANNGLNSIFTNLKSNIDEFGLKARSIFYTLGETLGDLIKQLANKNTAKFMESITKDAKSFSDLKDNWKNMSSQDKWSAGLGMAGSAVLSMSSPSDSVGQGLGGALTGAAAGTAILPGWGTAIGAVVGGVSGLLKAAKNRRQEKILLEQYEEQKKANRLLERMSALTYASQIIGQKTEYGIVSGVRRNEFGQIVSVVQGQDIIMVADRTNKQKGR